MQRRRTVESPSFSYSFSASQCDNNIIDEVDVSLSRAIIFFKLRGTAPADGAAKIYLTKKEVIKMKAEKVRREISSSSLLSVEDSERLLRATFLLFSCVLALSFSGGALSALICFLHFASFGEGPSRAGQYVVTPNNGGRRLLPPAKQPEPTRVDVNRAIVRIKLPGHPSLTNSLFWPFKVAELKRGEVMIIRLS
jgi:hypothetical protein